MELQEYLKRSDETIENFAKRAQVGAVTIWRITSKDEYRANSRTLEKISVATKGEVTVMELLFPEKQSEQAA